MRSLQFTLSTAEDVQCGNASLIQNMNPVTVCAWFYPDSLRSDEYNICNKAGQFTNNGWTFQTQGTGELRLGVDRATTNTIALSSSTDVNANEWNFAAAQWDTGGVNADQKLFWGNIATTAAEVGSYTSQLVGSGTVQDDSGNNFQIGRVVADGTFSTMDGRISVVGVWERLLSLSEIQRFQYNPWHLFGSSQRLLVVLGLHGTGQQVPDLSGNSNNGTITGTSLAVGPPLRGPSSILTFTGEEEAVVEIFTENIIHIQPAINRASFY